MTRFHVNSKGQAGPCGATAGRCPFGGADGTENHYDSMEAAATAAMESSVSTTATPRMKLRSAKDVERHVAEARYHWIGEVLPLRGEVRPQQPGGFAATSPDGQGAWCFDTEAEALEWARGRHPDLP